MFHAAFQELIATDAAGALRSSLLWSGVLALLMGLRHATDPDHLVAVTELIATEDQGTRRAARLGAAWGLGHASVIILAGAPMIWLERTIPEAVGVWLERAVGVVIIALAIRLLFRLAPSQRGKPARPARTAAGALAVGALHGLAGSAAVVLLAVAVAKTPALGITFLALFAPMTALSMIFCSVCVSWALERTGRRLHDVSVVLVSLFSLVFGGFYLAGL